VQQQTMSVVERLGKYNRTAQPGFNFKIPVIETIAGRLSMRIRQLDVPVETKTLDNVFVKVAVSVQYFVLPNEIFAAFYKLDNPEQQITSFIFDVVRARVPKMKLDDVFEKKDDIADAVKAELTDIMSQFGYGILKALVTDIDPDAKVKAAMNEINEAQRLRVAANERGEAEKILKVKQAEAEAKSNALLGVGIADQRKAIIDGLKDSIDGFQKTVTGTGPMEVMNLVLMTQYFDMLKSIGADSKNSSIFVPHSPGNIGDLTQQIRDAMLQAQTITPQTDQTKAQKAK
jgi:regulator of protease activity HflC (stomatin/prohibitin superfamily)